MVAVRRLDVAHRMPSEGGPALRKQTILFFGGAFLASALGSLLFSPAPVGAVAREIIELQRDVTALLQGQNDITTTIDHKHATIKTPLEQNTSAVSALN